MTKARHPATLRDALGYFADTDRCLELAVAFRWPDGVRCPGCGGAEVTLLASRQVWKCKRAHAGRQFSIKVGTIFEDSPIAMDKWLGAIWMIANRPEDTAASSLVRMLGVTPKTASFMLHRIQLAMNTGAFSKRAFPGKKAARASVIALPRSRRMKAAAR